jgi:hypothetical protein
VIKGSNARRWYNELKGHVIAVDKIVKGVAFKMDCGKKYNNHHGTIPAEHFELVTHGLDHFIVKITHTGAGYWYKVGETYNVIPDKESENYYMPINLSETFKHSRIYKHNVAIMGAVYKPIGDQLTDAFKGAQESLKGFDKAVNDFLGSRPGHGKTSFMVDYRKPFIKEQSDESITSRITEFLSNHLPHNKSVLATIFDDSENDAECKKQIIAILKKFGAKEA